MGNIKLDNDFKQNTYDVNIQNGSSTLTGYNLLDSEINSGSFSYNFSNPVLNKSISIYIPKLNNNSIINNTKSKIRNKINKNVK